MLGEIVHDREVGCRFRNLQTLAVIPLGGVAVQENIAGSAVDIHSSRKAAAVCVLNCQSTHDEVRVVPDLEERWQSADFYRGRAHLASRRRPDVELRASLVAV